MTKSTTIIIDEPNLETIQIPIMGTSPYVQHKFSEKSKKQMLDAQIEGSGGKNKKKRIGRNIEAEYRDAIHFMAKDQPGIPAPAFRAAMISACRLVGFVMTKAKLTVFVEPDGFDIDDGTPLVKLVGEHEMHTSHVRLATGVASIAVRPMWRAWTATLRIRFDADQFSSTDVANLVRRAGLQVGIGEGRPDSKKSNGLGWGLFEINPEHTQ